MEAKVMSEKTWKEIYAGAEGWNDPDASRLVIAEGVFFDGLEFTIVADCQGLMATYQHRYEEEILILQMPIPTQKMAISILSGINVKSAQDLVDLGFKVC